MVRRLGLGKTNHLTYASLALNPRYANSADPDQTAPEGTVLSASSLFTIPRSIFKRQMHKKKNLSKKVWNKMEIYFRTFTIIILFLFFFVCVCVCGVFLS